MIYRFALPLIILALAAFGCENSTDTADAEEKIRASWSDFIDSWNKMDAPGVVEIYMEDALNVPPGMDAWNGKAELEEFYSSLFNDHLSSHYTHEIKSLEISNNSAVEYGEFTVEWERLDESTWTFRGRSMTHWVKTDDGDWKIKTFVFNNPPEE